MRITDCQVHIWKASTPERPWPQAGHPPQRAEPLGYPELLTHMQGAGVDRAVLVPPNWEGDRVDYALEAAAAHPDKFGIMGRVPLRSPDCPALLETWLAQKGMLGIRVSFHRPSDQPLFTSGEIDWFWPAAERYNIPLMIHSPLGLEAIGAIAGRQPGLKLIIDHMGLDRDLKDDAVLPSFARLIALAKHPNVYVKVSAAPCFSTGPYPYRNIHAHLRRVIDAFGPQRCMWGTDLTRLPANCSYRQAVTMFTEEMPLSDSEKEWIMDRSLSECLNWK